MTTFASKAPLLGCAGAVFAMLFLGAAAPAQPIPDFSSPSVDGKIVTWGRGGGVNMEQVPGSPSVNTQDPRYPYYSNQTAIRLGVLPTYRIADLSNPNIKQWAKDVMKKDNDEVLAGKLAYTPGSSCKQAGVPDFMQDGGPFFFVQTPEKVVIYTEGNYRHVYMNVPHTKNPKPTWLGESVGHYEGDTLVIDTIGMNNKTFVDHYRTPHTEKLHVIERWRKIDDGKKMEVVVTIDDPDTFVQPWKGRIEYNRQVEEMTEYSCAEGNITSIALGIDWHIPTATKADF